MDAAVDFAYDFVCEAGTLEVAIDIGGEHMHAPGTSAPHPWRISNPGYGGVAR